MCRKQGKEMEEKNISEKESLELISQMIQHTQKRITVGSGNPFIVWGVITIVVSTVVGLAILLTGNWMWMLGYSAIPVLGWVYQYVNKRRVRNSSLPQMKTYIEENLRIIWRGIGIILLAYLATIFVFRPDEPRAWMGAYFIGVFMPMIGAYLTCLLLKIQKNVYFSFLMGACILMLTDLLIEDTMTNKYNFLFALYSFFSLVIPGFIINKEAHKGDINKNSDE